MKKIQVIGITISIVFALSFVALNLYNSNSFVGFSGNKDCNFCHNDPTFAKTFEGSIDITAFHDPLWDDLGQYSTNYFPVVNTNNRSEHGFIKTQFLNNGTHMFVSARISDSTINESAAYADKFALVWNIDVDNFTVGMFLTTYSEGATVGSMTVDNGHADMWMWDASLVAPNTTGKAKDMFINTVGKAADTTSQDVTVAVHHGNLGRSVGYYVYFVRALTTADTDDVQFDTEGAGTKLALATWDDAAGINHFSSFDKTVIFGDAIGVVDYVTEYHTVYTTVTAPPEGNTSAFTVVTLIAGLVFAIPMFSYYRRRK